VIPFLKIFTFVENKDDEKNHFIISGTTSGEQ
jgi:hypothetical protein